MFINVISEPIRPQPDESVVAGLREHDGRVALPAPVWHELLFGCLRLPTSRKRETLEQYLHEVVQPTTPILPYDEAACEYHAEERARLVGEGRTPSFVDGQIAAIAHVTDLVLVTRNVGDFEGFRDLRTECWHKG